MVGIGVSRVRVVWVWVLVSTGVSRVVIIRLVINRGGEGLGVYERIGRGCDKGLIPVTVNKDPSLVQLITFRKFCFRFHVVGIISSCLFCQRNCNQ